MRTLVSLVVTVAVIGGMALVGQLLLNAGHDNDGIDSSNSADSRNPGMGRTLFGNWTGLLAVTWAARDEKAGGGRGEDSSSDSSDNMSDSSSSSSSESTDSMSESSGGGAAGDSGGELETTSSSSAEVASCPQDINRNGYVDVLDLIEVLICYGQSAAPGCQHADLVHDGVVNVMDLLDLLTSLGQPCASS